MQNSNFITINKNFHFDIQFLNEEDFLLMYKNFCTEENYETCEKIFIKLHNYKNRYRIIDLNTKETIGVLGKTSNTDFYLEILNDFYKCFDFDSFI